MYLKGRARESERERNHAFPTSVHSQELRTSLGVALWVVGTPALELPSRVLIRKKLHQKGRGVNSRHCDKGHGYPYCVTTAPQCPPVTL